MHAGAALSQCMFTIVLQLVYAIATGLQFLGHINFAHRELNAEWLGLRHSLEPPPCFIGSLVLLVKAWAQLFSELSLLDNRTIRNAPLHTFPTKKHDQ
mgnify:CR=1 FL=1